MQKITPFLWYDGKAEEAAKFYTSIFRKSKIVNVRPGPKGSVMGVEFQLEGQQFMALSSGNAPFTFSSAISLFVSCETQEEVDALWSKLTADGGSEEMCGWLKDKYGVSWQIIPTVLGEMLQDKDAGKAKRVMEAMLQMKKINIKGLKEAYGR